MLLLLSSITVSIIIHNTLIIVNIVISFINIVVPGPSPRPGARAQSGASKRARRSRNLRAKQCFKKRTAALARLGAAARSSASKHRRLASWQQGFESFASSLGWTPRRSTRLRPIQIRKLGCPGLDRNACRPSEQVVPGHLSTR